jgi:hypothetical protein
MIETRKDIDESWMHRVILVHSFILLQGRDSVHGSNVAIPAADIHGMSSPEERLMKAVWGKPEIMYDRRQKKPRRSGWRGGRRESDWPDSFVSKRQQQRLAKAAKRLM